MTSSRNLGPVLAIAGAAVVGAAVVAGFLVVGGPGDARNARLDEQTLAEVKQTAQHARCAFTLLGRVPDSMQEIRTAIEERTRLYPEGMCRQTRSDEIGRAEPVEYERVDDTHIRLCADFRAPTRPVERERFYAYFPDGGFFPELDAPRPQAGRHCFELEMLPMKIDPPPSPADPPN
jgi:hypothetical protein